MNEISIPIHLIIPTFFCFVGFTFIVLYRKKVLVGNKLLRLSIALFFLLYVLIVGSAAISDIYYQWNMNQYDLDRDGFFSGAEITKEQIAASKLLVNDTGRNFSFITGFIFAFCISLFVYFLGSLFRKSKLK